MLAFELDFDLPPELIAQEPAAQRDAARLLHLRRDGCGVAHRMVRDLPELLRPDDLLVFNNTRVLRARLQGYKENGQARIEVLLLRELERNRWEALVRPSARLRPGAVVVLHSLDGIDRVRAMVGEPYGAGRVVDFDLGDGDIRDLLARFGAVPLPPYINRSCEAERYQTVYARSDRTRPGAALESAAAPTAGLHFTPELLHRLAQRGIATAYVTLGVGVGTFRPVQTETVEEHVMHEEEFEVPAATAAAIAAQRERGGRVVAVGTTTVRVLESVADDARHVTAGFNRTRIFIRPGYRFRCTDAMITNFHLPRSTLLAMVAAFAEAGHVAAAVGGSERLTGLECIRYAYSQAIAERYRFFSFGDAMFIE